MYLMRIVDDGANGQFHYEFHFFGDRGIADLAVSVDGVSGQARMMLRPCTDDWSVGDSGKCLPR
jgi:hypothetical protein